MWPRVAILAVGFVGATALAFQQPARFVSRIDAVVVHARARSENGTLAGYLTRDDFTILDNGQPREIVVFSRDPEPIAASIVLDLSGSTAEARAGILSAAEAFIDSLGDGDRASLMTLTWDCLPMTADRRALKTVLRLGGIGDYGSPVWSALDRARLSLAHETGRRAILLLSDGGDTGSLAYDSRLARPPGVCQPITAHARTTAGDVARAAAIDGVLVYAVGVHGQQVTDTRGSLVDVTRVSGGDYTGLRSAERMREVFARVADELRQMYTLGFIPDVFDGKEHRVEVRTSRPGVNVRARTHYLADRNAATLARPAPRPTVPVTDDDVRRAIENGGAGRHAGVTCIASGAFKNRPKEEADVVARVQVEGPLNRIASRAREAAARGQPFDSRSVTDDLREPFLRVVAELAPRSGAGMPASGPFVAPSTVRRITAVRIWSDDRRVQVLNPVSAVTEVADGRRLSGGDRVTSTYDLAAFRALPAGSVDVAVYSYSGERTCQLTTAERERVR